MATPERLAQAVRSTEPAAILFFMLEYGQAACYLGSDEAHPYFVSALEVSANSLFEPVVDDDWLVAYALFDVDVLPPTLTDIEVDEDGQVARVLIRVPLRGRALLLAPSIRPGVL